MTSLCLSSNLLPMRNQLLSCVFLISLLANVAVFVSGHCQSEQQLLLLQFKKGLIFDSELSVNLSQWSQGTDCCSWGGVHCNEDGRVIGLDLSNESISGGIENATGLFRLQSLQSLNLAFNWFNGTQIPSRLANLTNLTYLNLSYSGFGGQIPVEISNLTRLVTLDLSSISFSFLEYDLLKLENPNLSMLVQNLVELRELYLDGVNISAHGNEWSQALSSSLPNLQVLSLSDCFLSGHIDSSLLNLRFLSVIRLARNNLSSPFPEFLTGFTNLTSLDLSSCGLHGIVPKNIFQVPTLKRLSLSNNVLLQGSLPEFSKNITLETLRLYNTNFSGTLPDSIGNLKYLSRIMLAGCNFAGLIPPSVSDLTQLVYLDLSFNNFVGRIPSFRMSKSLTILDLSYNVLSGGISSTAWERFSNLRYVDLSYNSLNGSIPISLFQHPSLKYLLLANNQFEGQLEFSNVSSSVLDGLDLTGNSFEGSIPMSIFELKDLEFLSLAFNKFYGTMQLNKILSSSNLTVLDLSYNNLTVNASNIGSFPPKLSALGLAGCKLSTIPDMKESKLQYLDLSENQIFGEIPNWIWEIGNGTLFHLNLSHNALEGLQKPYSVSDFAVLDLHSNRLRGKIPQFLGYVAYLDLSSNKFNSSIPGDIGDFLAYTEFLSLSNNNLAGVIPESLCIATYLRVVDLSNNNLVGTLPRCLIKWSSTLDALNLKRNNLTGTISDAFTENCGLRTINLNGNRLEGVIPKSLALCKSLEVLDLGNNQISGNFPCWLENISSLRVLNLRSNKFYGNIGCRTNNSSWRMLQVVDLASNNFNGSLPRNFLKTWEAMMVNETEAQSNLKRSQFELGGVDQTYYRDSITVTYEGLGMQLVNILTLFTSVDLSSNKFQGSIPEEIGLLKSLYVLNLSHNALTGSIPSSIGNLRQLESLDLSMNNLSGAIPVQLGSLNFLSFFNVSYNQLEGRIPSSAQLQTFPPASFEGNKGLCGLPLANNCTNSR